MHKPNSATKANVHDAMSTAGCHNAFLLHFMIFIAHLVEAVFAMMISN